MTTKPHLASESLAQDIPLPREEKFDARRLALNQSGVKRALDILFSCVVFVLGAPVMALIAALIKLDSKGPVLFVQTRIGRGGKPFRMLKFRTMRVASSDSNHRTYVANLICDNRPSETIRGRPVYKLTQDPRVTRFGRFLRKTGLDELPQFWNVLLGNMSVVGPRPPLPYEVELYSSRHHERLATRPGITGLWQISGRSRRSFDEMVELDLRYLRDWTLGLDLKIIALTIPEVFGLRRNGF